MGAAASSRVGLVSPIRGTVFRLLAKPKAAAARKTIHFARGPDPFN